MKLLVCLVLGLMLGLPAAVPAVAQETVPEVRDAELIFEQGLEAFTGRDYGMAYRRFRLIYEGFQLNRKTTAAYLMAGRALYQDARYQEAADLLGSFIARYPTSSYLNDARRTREYALQQVGELEAQQQVMDLGIVLPLTGEDASLTQAIFHGIRLAVDENNADPTKPKVRMVFRDTRADPSQAAQAVASLALDGVKAIVGPLYSDEARAAAAAAERAAVVLIAPLATDEDVSEGRRFVFQANPTITMRGRLMARFAMRSLRLDDFGIVAVRGNSSNAAISERMAEGFQQEAHMEGANILFYKLLPDARSWAQFGNVVGADTLAAARAVYLPASGADARQNIGAALGSLDRLSAGVRVLGNAEWHDLPFVRQASTYQATYTNDFYVDDARPEVQAFLGAYRKLSGDAPDRLGFTGYDVTRFLLTQGSARPELALADALRAAPLYQGTGIRIDFVDTNVNEAMYYLRYRDGRVDLLR